MNAGRSALKEAREARSADHAERSTAARALRPRHRLRLLKGGTALFAALVEAIDSARAQVLLETYILEISGDVVPVAEALERAAARGVTVRLVVDGIGTPVVPAEWQSRWQAAGLEFRTYNPARGWRMLLPQGWRRMHRKLCVVDGRVGFCGGINLLDDRVDPNYGPLVEPRLDFAVRVVGPLVDDMHETMTRLWLRMEVAREARHQDFGAALAAVRAAARAGADMNDPEMLERFGDRAESGDAAAADERSGSAPAAGVATAAQAGDAARPLASAAAAASSAASAASAASSAAGAFASAAPVPSVRPVPPVPAVPFVASPSWLRRASDAALVLRDNLRFRRRIEHTYRYAINQAKTEIVIANAYFVPGVKLQRALLKARKRGVRVTLLLQGRYEYFMQHHTSRALYAVLLGAGIEIVEYRASFLHAKVAVFDGPQGAMATVGSSNLDPLSLLLAREANIFVRDEAFAQELKAHLMDAIEHQGERVEATAHLHRPFGSRALSWVAYAMMRIALLATGNRY